MQREGITKGGPAIQEKVLVQWRYYAGKAEIQWEVLGLENFGEFGKVSFSEVIDMEAGM